MHKYIKYFNFFMLLCSISLLADINFWDTSSTIKNGLGSKIKMSIISGEGSDQNSSLEPRYDFPVTDLGSVSSISFVKEGPFHIHRYEAGPEFFNKVRELYNYHQRNISVIIYEKDKEIHFAITSNKDGSIIAEWPAVKRNRLISYFLSGPEFSKGLSR